MGDIHRKTSVERVADRTKSGGVNRGGRNRSAMTKMALRVR